MKLCPRSRVLFVFALGCFLVALELVARVERGARPRWEPAAPAEPRTSRVVVLGDRAAFAPSARPEEAVPHLLEVLGRTDASGLEPMGVLDWTREGARMEEWAAALSEQLPRLGARAWVIVLGGVDVEVGPLERACGARARGAKDTLASLAWLDEHLPQGAWSPDELERARARLAREVERVLDPLLVAARTRQIRVVFVRGTRNEDDVPGRSYHVQLKQASSDLEATGQLDARRARLLLHKTLTDTALELAARHRADVVDALALLESARPDALRGATRWSAEFNVDIARRVHAVLRSGRR